MPSQSDSGRPALSDRLQHMLEAADTIAGYVARGRKVFDDDAAVRDAILYRIIVLGEASKEALKADPDIATSYPDVDWSPMARMRDRVAQHYWATDYDIVWVTTCDAVPALRTALAAVLVSIDLPA